MKELGKESRKGLTNGVRAFIKVDTERALDVGSLSRGTRNITSPEAESSGSGLGCDSQGEPG